MQPEPPLCRRDPISSNVESQIAYAAKQAAIGKKTRLVFAGTALISILLFSAVNCLQKNFAAGLAFTGFPLLQLHPFVIDLVLFVLFAACSRLALPRCKNAEQSRIGPGRMRDAQGLVYDPLLSLRAFACLTVIGGHALGFTLISPDVIPFIRAGRPIWLLTPAPEAGVWIFFTLSGYLIAKGFGAGRYRLSRESIAIFYRNRILRIVPLYWFTLCVYCVLFIPKIFRFNNWPALINMLFFNVDGHLPYLPIGALWSISTEVQFYAAAPVIFLLFGNFAQRPGAKLLSISAIMLGSIYLRRLAFETGGLHDWYAFAYEPLIANIDIFLIGVAASSALLVLRNQNIPVKNGILYGSLLMLMLYVLTSYLRAHAVLVQTPLSAMLFAVYSPTLSAALTALIIACFELAPKNRPGSLIYRFGHPTEFIGTLTYAAYSWHEPILLLLERHFVAENIPVSLAACLLVTIGIFAISVPLQRFVERPFKAAW